MRYTSDLTDAEWSLIDYCFPKPCSTGRPREHSYRELVNAVFYLVKTACQCHRLCVHAQLDHFERHPPPDRFALFGGPDRAETAFAELFEELVTSDEGAGFFGREGVVEDGGQLIHGGVLHEAVLFEMASQEGFEPATQIHVPAAGFIKESRAVPGRGAFESGGEDLAFSAPAGWIRIVHGNRL
jgi:hypothetical protein